ncbi:hypothetical protein BASA81_000397 [Batrachochytrium salamandrivorans]|nr:hypothetical protein BASA81_000397 [Batrachochytrium salamandrivorans]
MSNNSSNKKAKSEGEVDIVGSRTPKQQLGVRAYLDQTVVPVLLQAMTALVKARPEDEDPAVFLANWILENQKKNPIGSIPKSVAGEEEEEVQVSNGDAAAQVKEEEEEEAPAPAASATSDKMEDE